MVTENPLVWVRNLDLKLESNIYHLCDFGKIIPLLLLLLSHLYFKDKETFLSC